MDPATHKYPKDMSRVSLRDGIVYVVVYFIMPEEHVEELLKPKRFFTEYTVPYKDYEITIRELLNPLSDKYARHLKQKDYCDGYKITYKKDSLKPITCDTTINLIKYYEVHEIHIIPNDDVYLERQIKIPKILFSINKNSLKLKLEDEESEEEPDWQEMEELQNLEEGGDLSGPTSVDEDIWILDSVASDKRDLTQQMDEPYWGVSHNLMRGYALKDNLNKFKQLLELSGRSVEDGLVIETVRELIPPKISGYVFEELIKSNHFESVGKTLQNMINDNRYNSNARIKMIKHIIQLMERYRNNRNTDQIDKVLYSIAKSYLFTVSSRSRELVPIQVLELIIQNIQNPRYIIKIRDLIKNMDSDGRYTIQPLYDLIYRRYPYIARMIAEKSRSTSHFGITNSDVLF